MSEKELILYSLVTEADRMTVSLIKEMGRINPHCENTQFIIGNGHLIVSSRPHSHIGKYDLQLENVTLVELKSAVELLEANAVVKQVSRVYDYYNTEVRTDAQVRMATPTGILAKRGMAVELRNGKIALVCDQYGAENELAKLRTTLTDAVKTIRLKNTLQKQKYRTTIKYKQAERAFILVGVQQ